MEFSSSLELQVKQLPLSSVIALCFFPHLSVSNRNMCATTRNLVKAFLYFPTEKKMSK